MQVGRVCNRNVAVARGHETVSDAARRMRAEGVGALVIVEEHDGKRLPIGLLTDRDIVVCVVAADGDCLGRRLDEWRRPNLVMAREGDDVDDVLELMENEGIRRVPVVDETGHLTGIFTLDDWLCVLASEVNRVRELVSWQRVREHRSRS